MARQKDVYRLRLDNRFAWPIHVGYSSQDDSFLVSMNLEHEDRRATLIMNREETETLVRQLQASLSNNK